MAGRCTTPSWSASLSERFWLRTNGVSLFWRRIFLFVCVCLIPHISICVKSPSNSSSKYLVGVDFLMKYGYLPQSDRETGEQRSEEEFSKAIAGFQDFAGIEATGKLDDRTIERMQRPRCGNADYIYKRKDRRIRRYALGPTKWDKKHLTWRILNYSPDLSAGDTRRAVHDAFAVWSDVADLRFSEVAYGDADMYIRFAVGYHRDGYPFDGRGLVLAHAFFPGQDRGGDIHFDDDEKWTVYSEQGTNLFSVAAHEIGHALGLMHSRVPGSLMYPWYGGFKTSIQLHYDDISGIHYLYGGKRRPYRTTTRFPTRRPVPTRQPTRPETTTKLQTRPPKSTTTTTTTAKSTSRRPITTRAASATTRSSTRPTRRPVIFSTTTTHSITTTTTQGTLAPGTCISTFDAMAVIRKELFIFRGKNFWRINENGPMAGYPLEIHRFWYKFPPEIQNIDAVYERPDGKIVFFAGNRYWFFRSNYPQSSWPYRGRPITELGLPADIDHIDAAFVWGHNKKTYFISGDMYWRYNEFTSSMDSGYPRDMSIWKGVQLPVKAALQHWNKKTYFFHGSNYSEFNDVLMEVRKGYPKPASKFWLNCTMETSESKTQKRERIYDVVNEAPGLSKISLLLYLWFSTVMLL